MPVQVGDDLTLSPPSRRASLDIFEQSCTLLSIVLYLLLVTSQKDAASIANAPSRMLLVPIMQPFPPEVDQSQFHVVIPNGAQQRHTANEQNM